MGVHKSKPASGSDHFVAQCLASVRWSAERGYHGIPNQPRAVPTYSLHAFELRADHLSRKSIPRTTFRGRNHNVRLRARIDVREMRPSPWQIYGMLPHVSG